MRKEGGEEGGREGGEGVEGREGANGKQGKKGNKKFKRKRTFFLPLTQSGLVNDGKLCDSSYKDRKTSFVSNN